MSDLSTPKIAESCHRGIVRRGIVHIGETHRGEGPPDPAFGVELSFYVNTTTGAIYRREAGAWRLLMVPDEA